MAVGGSNTPRWGFPQRVPRANASRPRTPNIPALAKGAYRVLGQARSPPAATLIKHILRLAHTMPRTTNNLYTPPRQRCDHRASLPTLELRPFSKHQSRKLTYLKKSATRDLLPLSSHRGTSGQYSASSVLPTLCSTDHPPSATSSALATHSPPGP